MTQPDHQLQRVSYNISLVLGLLLLPVVAGLILVAALNSNGELQALTDDAELAVTRRPLIAARSSAGLALSRLEATAYNDLRTGTRSNDFDRALSAFKSRRAEFEAELERAATTWPNDTAVLAELRRETERFNKAHDDIREPYELPEASWRFFSSVDWPTLSPSGDSWNEQAAVVSNLNSIHGIGFDHFAAITARLLSLEQVDSLPDATGSWIRSVQASNELESISTADRPLEERSTLRILQEVFENTDPTALSVELSNSLEGITESDEMEAIKATTPFLLGLVSELEVSPEALLQSIDKLETQLQELSIKAHDQLMTHITEDVRQKRRERSIRFSALAIPGLLGVALFALVEARRRRANRTLTDAAVNDQLTGLPNRFALQSAAETALAVAAPNDAYASLMLFDVDNFKTINDTFGHSIGDGALVAFGNAINAITQDGEQVYRLGGDEFVVFCTHPDAFTARPEALSSSLRETLRSPLKVAHHRLQLDTSCGASTRAVPTSLSELLIEADLALHEVKEDAKNGFLHYRDTRRGPLIRTLRPMLEASALQFAFQPQVDLNSGNVSGLEALCRWPSDCDRTFKPIDIVDSVEWLGHTDLFLTNLVNRIEEAQAQLQGHFAGRYWLNVWPSQFEAPDVERSLLSRLSDSAIVLDRVGVEITEKRRMTDAKRAREAANALRKQGVAVGLDDFGVFNASIERLTAIPLDVVKVDRRLIHGISTNPEQRLFVKALREICTNRNLRLIAEGIEDAGDLVTVAELGINDGQGFCISPALELNELIPFLDSWSPRDFLTRCNHR